MNATVKLKPVRLSMPKYGNALMLAMEYLAKTTIVPTGIYDTKDRIELELPYTKHSIKPMQQYINNNL